MMLLSDGTVIVKTFNGGTDGYGNTWYKLTPSSTGSYVNGTWTTLASMHDTRLYGGTQILKDGRVYVSGGEYGTGKTTAETYDPTTNIWTLAPAAGHTFSDSNSEILSDGRVINALVEGTLKNTLIFNPVANSWATGPTCNGIHNESAWVKLPDDSILFVDRLTTNSERYIPAQNQWITDATVPVSLYDPYGDETGPGMLLPNGKVIYFGATGHTAIYTPSGSTANGSWIAGPDFPNGQGMPDAPCAMMANGRILCAVAPIPISGNVFQSPTTFYEYDYTTNSFTSVPTPTGGTLNHSSYQGTMLTLPDGSLLYSDFGTQIYNYQGGGAPLASSKPTITTISQNGDGSFHLVGTQLNGVNEGCAYGDDNQNATNYPIVRLTNGANVYYARTYNWSRTSVATGSTPVTTEFTLPANLPQASYSLVVIANGIASDPYQFNPFTHLTLTVPASVTEGSAPLTGTVTASSAPATNLVVALSSSDATQASVPSTVTILAGQTLTNFSITIVNDNLLNGSRTVTLTGSATGYANGTAPIVINDSKTATLTVSVPTPVSETAGTVQGTLGISAPPDVAVTVSMTSSNTASLQVPSTVTIPAGQTSVNFAITIVDDHLINGDQQATITAHVTNWTDGTAAVLIQEADNQLTLALPTTVYVGAAATATVSIGGTTTTAVTVTLTSDNPARLTVSSPITIPAGSTSATFTLTAPTASGGATANISATAVGFNAASGAVTVAPRVAFFDLSTDPGWTRQGEWAYGTPTGGGGVSNGNHDPTSGATGSNVFGINLAGDYSTTVGGPYYLTTGAISTSGYSGTQLRFKRWLNTDYPPYVNATIDVLSDGTSWTNIFANASGVTIA